MCVHICIHIYIYISAGPSGASLACGGTDVIPCSLAYVDSELLGSWFLVLGSCYLVLGSF